MAEFFAMGGYAFHVWTCWGSSAVLLGGFAVAVSRRMRRTSRLVRNIDAQARLEGSKP